MGDHDHGSYRDGPCPGCERELAERTRVSAAVAPVAGAERKARVFTENDVQNLLRPLLHLLGNYRERVGESRGQLTDDELERVLVQIVKDAPSELTEEVIARSEVVRMLCDATANTWHVNSQDPADLSREDAEAFIGGEAGVEVVRREDADRLVALALLFGAAGAHADYDGIPRVAWQALEDAGLMRWAGFGGADWEREPVITDEGEAFLRAELERDR
jgi:hypothetical protein